MLTAESAEHTRSTRVHTHIYMCAHKHTCVLMCTCACVRAGSPKAPLCRASAVGSGGDPQGPRGQRHQTCETVSSRRHRLTPLSAARWYLGSTALLINMWGPHLLAGVGVAGREWLLNVRFLSLGAAHTLFCGWG